MSYCYRTIPDGELIWTTLAFSLIEIDSPLIQILKTKLILAMAAPGALGVQMRDHFVAMGTARRSL